MRRSTASGLVLGAALLLACAPERPWHSPDLDVWSSSPDFVDVEAGRPLRVAIVSRWPLRVVALCMRLDDTRFWGIKQPIDSVIEKPASVGPGSHRLSVAVEVIGVGELAGYRMVVTSKPHDVNPDVAKVTLLLDWEENGEALQERPKLRWSDELGTAP